MQRGAPGAFEASARKADTSVQRLADNGPALVRAPNLPPLLQPKRRAADAPHPLDDDPEVASAYARDVVEASVGARDLASLQKLRAQLDERADAELLATREDQALDLAIACLSEQPNAQQRALAFYTDEPATELHMRVRSTCLGQP